MALRGLHANHHPTCWLAASLSSDPSEGRSLRSLSTLCLGTAGFERTWVSQGLPGPGRVRRGDTAVPCGAWGQDMQSSTAHCNKPWALAQGIAHNFASPSQHNFLQCSELKIVQGRAGPRLFLSGKLRTRNSMVSTERRADSRKERCRLKMGLRWCMEVRVGQRTAGDSADACHNAAHMAAQPLESPGEDSSGIKV
jgi:hypothetical protein